MAKIWIRCQYGFNTFVMNNENWSPRHDGPTQLKAWILIPSVGGGNRGGYRGGGRGGAHNLPVFQCAVVCICSKPSAVGDRNLIIIHSTRRLRQLTYSVRLSLTLGNCAFIVVD